VRFREQLEEELFGSHKEFAENPLLLSIMLLIFGRTAKIPTKTYKFYQDALETLAERLDANKGFERTFKSGLSKEQFEDCFAEICFRAYKEERYELSEAAFENYYNDLKTVTVPQRFADFWHDIHVNLCLMVVDGGVSRFIHRSFQEYFAALFLAKAFARVSSESKGAWSAFLIDFFERHGYHSYNNAILEMLYEMAFEKVEEYILTPYLEALFAESDDMYLRFLGKLYPSSKLTYDFHDIVNEYVDEDSDEICEEDESYYDFSLDSDGMAKSGIMGFIVHSVLDLDADDENVNDDWPYEYDHIMEKVPLAIKELERLEEEERNTHEVYRDDSIVVHAHAVVLHYADPRVAVVHQPQ